MKKILTLALAAIMAAVFFIADARTTVRGNRLTDPDAGLDIEFSEMRHDFGSIPADGGPVTHEFSLTNNASEPLALLSVKASCGCTRPEYSKKPLAPGKSSKIKVTFLPAGQQGEFTKDVKIRVKAGKHSGKHITLKISGTVIPAK